MQTFDELVKSAGLDHKQTPLVRQFIHDLVIELLVSLKEENLRNFDETIASLPPDSDSTTP